jgi:hypothetical protein
MLVSCDGSRNWSTVSEVDRPRAVGVERVVLLETTIVEEAEVHFAELIVVIVGVFVGTLYMRAG